MLQTIRKYQERLKKSFKINYKRYLYRSINFDDKMIAIFGARGVGKTTTLFQYLGELEQRNMKAFYISLDYPFLSGVDLIELIEEFANEGGSVSMMCALLKVLHNGYYRWFEIWTKAPIQIIVSFYHSVIKLKHL